MKYSFLFLRYTWITNYAFFDVLKEGYQTLFIPKTGTYSFEVIAAGNQRSHEFPGARICGKIRLERGEKITVALGQQSESSGGSGGTFVVKNTGKFIMPGFSMPLFIAGGTGFSSSINFGRASLAQTAHGNNQVGSSGVQIYQSGDVQNFYCAGAGYRQTPNVGQLCERSEPPQNYLNGLMGGKGFNHSVRIEDEGGFGGGGASFIRRLNGIQKYYYGAGGGFTGGSTRIQDSSHCDGGGGGSFSSDQNATFDYKYEKFGKCKIEFLN